MRMRYAATRRTHIHFTFTRMTPLIMTGMVLASIVILSKSKRTLKLCSKWPRR